MHVESKSEQVLCLYR